MSEGLSTPGVEGLEVDGLVCRVGPGRRAVTVLHELDLVAPAGGLTVVVGPSGSGKTTLLRAVAGLHRADAGTVRIDGDDVTSLPPGDRNVALAFQDLALFPHLDVRDNLAFGLRARRTPRDEIDARVAEAAAALGLDGLLDRRPSELSGGEAQRVALGRALVRRPRLLLLDEPFGALDALYRRAARDLVQDVRRRLAVTTVIVTHDPLEASAIADVLAVLIDGQIVQQGPPTEVYDRPLRPDIAALVGALPANELADGRWIRPERVSVVDAAAATVSIDVQAVEPWGADAIVRGTSDDGRPLAARVPRPTTVCPGDRVGLAWRPDDERRTEDR